MTTFENQLIIHTSPTLLGIKQANMFSFPIEKLSEYRLEIKNHNDLLNKLGIYIDYLYKCSRRVFIIVYRKSNLINYLKNDTVSKFLIKEGYPENPGYEENFKKVFSYLRKRTNNYNEFPHEIGFFLGYPPYDVFEYIYQKGANFKFCGYWKVYKNEESARRMFVNYEKCKSFLLRKAIENSDTPVTKLLGAI